MGTSLIVHDTIHDTIHSVVYLSTQKSSDAIDILNKMDSFYSSAWSKLILFVSLSFIVIGILVPLLFQFYQNRKLKIEKKSLEVLIQNKLTSEILKSKNELMEIIKSKIEVSTSQLDRKLAEAQSSAKARDFHTQANTLFREGKYTSALEDYITAAEEYLKTKDIVNLQIVLDSCIFLNILPKLSLEELGDVNEGYTSLDGLLDLLRESDNAVVFKNIISRISKLKKSLPKTIQEKEELAKAKG